MWRPQRLFFIVQIALSLQLQELSEQYQDIHTTSSQLWDLANDWRASGENLRLQAF